ncbi:MAG: hypothetical protein WC565_02160 [Parcubacteria group bacterium]
MKTPKLRLGVKAVALALALYFLPVWAAGILAAFLYFWPLTFSFSFVLSFIAFLLSAGSFFIANFSPFSGWPGVIASVIVAALFVLLLGVKNVIFIRRAPFFFVFLGVIIFASLYGFFAGIIHLPILALVVFFFCRDALASFTPASEPTEWRNGWQTGRTGLLAVVSSLLVTELAWAVFYLNLSVIWATVSVFISFSGAFYMIVEYLRGKLYQTNAPFIAVLAVIASFVILLFTAF